MTNENTGKTDYKNPLQDAVDSSFFVRMNIRLLKIALVVGGLSAFVMGGLFRLFS